MTQFHNGVEIVKRRQIIFGYKLYEFNIRCTMCGHQSTYQTLGTAREASREHAALHIMGQKPLPIGNLR